MRSFSLPAASHRSDTGCAASDRAQRVHTAFSVDDLREGDPTLSETDVERLVRLIHDRLAEVGDPAIRPPSAREIRAERQWLPHNHYDFLVEVDIGYTVLELKSQYVDRGRPPSATPNLELMADAIAVHVRCARDDHVAMAQVEAAEATIRAKLKRDRLDLEILSIRFAPGSLHGPVTLADRCFWVRARLLDDLLLPYVAIMQGSARQICSQLKEHGASEGRRRTALTRLDAQGGVLEIEEAAEHVVAATGNGLGCVSRQMLERRRPYNGNGMRVVLWGGLPGPEVSVLARDGRIRLEASLGDLDWTWDRGIRIRGSLPETVIAALAGRPLRTLVEHPLLPRDVLIGKAERLGWNVIEATVDLKARPICLGAIGPHWPARSSAGERAVEPISGRIALDASSRSGRRHPPSNSMTTEASRGGVAT